jgi:hypothetical protein
VISVITGGQTGVDTGALLAAREAKLEAWAMLPKGNKREKPMPDWMKAIATQSKSREYDGRTREVVDRSDAVLVIKPDVKMTPGTALTRSLAVNKGKQIWWFRNHRDRALWKAEAHAVAYWLRSLEVALDEGHDLTLMIAGPRAGKWPTAENDAFVICQLMFRALNGDAPPAGWGK